jgi:small subunit ribosomal protein S11
MFGFKKQNVADQQEIQKLAKQMETPAADSSPGFMDLHLDQLLRKRVMDSPNILHRKSVTKQNVSWVTSALPDDVHYVTVTSTLNNTFIICQDKSGKILGPTISRGILKLTRGGKSAVGPAALTCTQKAAEDMLARGIRNIVLRLSGFAVGRSAATSVIRQSELNIVEVQDVTPIPHNGPRPKKFRRRKRGVTRRLKAIRY